MAIDDAADNDMEHAAVMDGMEDDAIMHGVEGDGFAAPAAAPSGAAVVVRPVGALAVLAAAASGGEDSFKAAVAAEFQSQVAIGGLVPAAYEDLNTDRCREQLPPQKDADTLVEEFRQADSAMTVGRARAASRRLLISPKRVLFTKNCQAYAYLFVFFKPHIQLLRCSESETRTSL